MTSPFVYTDTRGFAPGELIRSFSGPTTELDPRDDVLISVGIILGKKSKAEISYGDAGNITLLRSTDKAGDREYCVAVAGETVFCCSVNDQGKRKHKIFTDGLWSHYLYGWEQGHLEKREDV